MEKSNEIILSDLIVNEIIKISYLIISVISLIYFGLKIKQMIKIHGKVKALLVRYFIYGLLCSIYLLCNVYNIWASYITIETFSGKVKTNIDSS